jgi:hypothetical protein
MTSAQLDAWLKETGQWDALQEKLRQQDERQKKLSAEYRVAEAPLVEELRAAGFNVESAWDFVKTPGSYPKAVPILLAHLTRPYPPAIREGIARALCVRDAIVGWELLTRLYRAEENKYVKDGLAVAISGAANDDVIGDVIALAQDATLSSGRTLLLSALERSKDPRALSALMSLGTDPMLAAEIQDILKRRLKRKKKASR